MPFDLQGARAAGYSDAEIASFLGQQAGFDTSAAVKSGYTPGEIIPFLSDRLSERESATKEQPTIADQAQSLGDPMGSGFSETAQPTAPQEAGAGRGFVNPSAVGERRDVGAGESFGRAVGRSAVQYPKTVNFLLSAPVVAAEAVANTFTGKSGDTKWQDWYFQKFVDPLQQAQDWYSLGPEERQSILAKVADGLGSLTADLPPMILSGGLTQEAHIAKAAPNVGAFLEQAVSRGFDAMRPIMVKAGTEKAQEVLDAGGTPEQAVKSAVTNALITGFQGAFPMSAEGNFATRAGTGAIVGAAQGEGARVIQNAADPENLRRDFSPEGLAVSAATGAVAAAALGRQTEVRREARAAATAEAEGVPAETPHVADVGRVLQAESVDEAIAAAKEAANPSPEGSMRSQMLAIRPMEKPSVSRENGIQPSAGGPGGDGLAQPARGVGDRAGLAVESAAGVPAETAPVGRAREPVSPAIADAVEAAGKVAPATPETVIPAAKDVASEVANISARRNESGTVTVTGEPAAVAALLRAHQIPFLPSADGAVVGRSRAVDAERVVADFAPARVESDSTPDSLKAPVSPAGESAVSSETAGPTPAVRLEPPINPTPGKVESDSTSMRSQVPKVLPLQGENTKLPRTIETVQAPLFRRSDNEALVGKSAQIHDTVSKLTRDWLRKPDIHVLRSMDEAPEPVRRVWEQQNSQGAVGDIEGFHWKGGVYLVGDALATKGDVQRVLFHEALGHFGLRGVFGDRLNGILNEVAVALPKEIARKAEQYGLDLANKRDRLTAAEEVLAEMAQTRPEMGVVKRAVAAIRTWLREHGIDSLKMTRDEIIANYLLPARGYVERARNPEPSSVTRESGPRFSRDGRYVLSPHGGEDFGEIDSALAKTIKRQAGKIRLEPGEHRPDGTGYGLAHIEANHGKQIRGAGFASVPQFIDYVAHHFDKLMQLSGNRQLLLAVLKDRADVMYVELQPAPDGDYYRVNTAFPARKEYLVKQQAKGAKLLWSGSEPRPTATGEQSPYASEPGKTSGPDAATAEGQDEGIVPPKFSRINDDQRTIEVDGVRRPVERSDGKPIIPNHDTEKLKNFYRWFDDSKVVDEQGRPLVVYHGTTEDVGAFDLARTGQRTGNKYGKGAIFFTDNANAASAYAAPPFGDTHPLDKPNVVPAYLSLKNPLVIDAEEGLGRNDGYRSWTHYKDRIAKAQKEGYDGVILRNVLDHASAVTAVQEGPINSYIAFSPEQIKSAIGNRGTFDPTSPDISFSRAAKSDPDLPDEVRAPYSGFGARMVKAATDFFADPKRDLMMKVAPMSATDNKQAQAMAQTYANQTRWAQVQWGRLQRFLEKNFTPEERKAMWEAADAENVARIRERDEESYTRPEGTGLASLNPKQREAVETLHEYGQGLWNAAREAGMVEGEGLPFWTPRMLVTIGEDGDIGKLRSLGGGPKMASDGTGRNITTNSSNLKHRKHLTTEETEAAASSIAKEQGAQGAKVVRDIMVMPLAMYRLERAIAGRQLVNQLKAIGQATGEDLVRDGAAEGYLTIPHPAFTTYRPRFANSEQGKSVVMTDEQGNVVMDRVPLYIRKDFEGPLRAVMSTKDGSLYTGYMLLKSKAMSAIMFSPLIHNMVIWGKAIPASPVKMLTFQLYAKGHQLLKDNQLFKQAILDGMVPIGENHAQSVDVTDIAQNFKPLGDRWGDPNESWLTLSIEKLGNVLHEGAGTSAKSKLDAAGEFLHHTLLWKQIGALQMGIYADAKQRYMAKGFSEQAAGIQAAHLANRYGGVIAKENQSEIARKWANVLLFSRSFNFTNLGTIKDSWGAMPTGLKALLAERAPTEANRAEWQQRRKAWSVIALDVGLAVIATSLMQDFVDAIKKDKGLDEIAQGYVDRAKEMAANIAANPLKPGSYNPMRLSSTFANEPGKKDRVDMGASVGDRHEYMRLPTGKVAEDLIGWTTETLETFERKMAPIPKAVMEASLGHTTIGMPVADPNGSIVKRIGEGVAHVVKAQLPWDDLKRVYDWMQGHATELDKKKVMGTVSGFTFSQGHPGGPEAAVNAKTSERFEQSRRYTMQLVKDDLKRGDEDKARERMEEIGMTPKEINRAINQALEPRSGLSKQARQKFERRANEEERQEMERQRSR